jgi:hypothetical protein
MKRAARLLSGLALGAILSAGAVAFAPTPASATSDVQCAETENYTCCCSMASDLVQQCSCQAKPRPILA